MVERTWNTKRLRSILHLQDVKGDVMGVRIYEPLVQTAEKDNWAMLTWYLTQFKTNTYANQRLVDVDHIQVDEQTKFRTSRTVWPDKHTH